MTNVNIAIPARHFGLGYVDGRYRVSIGAVNPDTDFSDTTDNWSEAASTVTAAMANPGVNLIIVSVQDRDEHRPAEPLRIYQFTREEDGLRQKVTPRMRKEIADSLGGPQEWQTL